jgi:hypothetical protein
LCKEFAVSIVTRGRYHHRFMLISIIIASCWSYFTLSLKVLL